MSFDIEVFGNVQRTLYETMSELVGEAAVRPCGDTVVLRVSDQAALVALITRLNDLCVQIEQVRREPPHDSLL
jgi:hypothetical protein